MRRILDFFRNLRKKSVRKYLNDEYKDFLIFCLNHIVTTNHCPFFVGLPEKEEDCFSGRWKVVNWYFVAKTLCLDIEKTTYSNGVKKEQDVITISSNNTFGLFSGICRRDKLTQEEINQVNYLRAQRILGNR